MQKIDQLLSILIQQQGVFVSGQWICEQLSVTRASIWKYIKKLQDVGYHIEAQTKTGYCLQSLPSSLDSFRLRYIANAQPSLIQAVYLPSIDSTNDEAKRRFDQQAGDYLIVAEEQTGGRGRLGRTWISQKGQGLYLSLLLQPNDDGLPAAEVTLMAGASMCKALRELTGEDVRIKWPNDLVVDHYKVGGILTEMSSEIGKLHYVLIGIGINTGDMKFTEDLVYKATSFYKLGKKVDNASLITLFLRYFYMFVQGNDWHSYNCKYSDSIGKWVDVRNVTTGQIKKVFVCGISEQGALIVQDESGEEQTLISAEVTCVY